MLNPPPTVNEIDELIARDEMHIRVAQASVRKLQIEIAALHLLRLTLPIVFDTAESPPPEC